MKARLVLTFMSLLLPPMVAWAMMRSEQGDMNNQPRANTKEESSESDVREPSSTSAISEETRTSVSEEPWSVKSEQPDTWDRLDKLDRNRPDQ